MRLKNLKTINLVMRQRGVRTFNFPRGIIVHWPAGSGIESSMRYGSEKGYHFLGISKIGEILAPRNFNLASWGNHAGTSNWPGVSVSKDLLGIEVDSAGLLHQKAGNWWSWFKSKIPWGSTRTVKAHQNMVAGTYERFTKAQEKALINLCLELKEMNPEVFNFDLVLGHDEVAGDCSRPGYGPGYGLSYQRKSDPGGALSMTMPDFREHLKGLWERREKHGR